MWCSAYQINQKLILFNIILQTNKLMKSISFGKILKKSLKFTLIGAPIGYLI